MKNLPSYKIIDTRGDMEVCALSENKAAAYEQLVGKIGAIGNCCSFLAYLRVLEERGLITLYAGTYSLHTASQMENIETASFYFYWNESESGFCFHVNRMGASLKKDDDLFALAHRRLYSKNYLSNCFFGEEDLRSGELFKKH